MLDWPLRQYQMKFYFWKMFPDFVIFYQAIIILWDWIYSIDCVSTTTNDFAKVSDQLLRLLTFVLPEYVQETFASDICYQIGITCNKSFKTFQKEPEYPVNNQKQWNFCISQIKAVLWKLFRVALLITVSTNKYYQKNPLIKQLLLREGITITGPYFQCTYSHVHWICRICNIFQWKKTAVPTLSNDFICQKTDCYWL